MNTEREFIPYKEALELEKLGFNFELDFGYDYEVELYIDDIEENINDERTTDDALCILYQQAFRWFREKYKLQHLIWSGKITKVFYGYDILHIDKQKYIINNSENGGGDCNCKTYEEAELACLKKLIKIAKQK